MTSKDVAKKAGVSRTTVSFVLNKVEGVKISKKTRMRVLQAAYKLGYVPDAAAQSLASGRSKTIGLILTRSPRQIASDTFLTQVLYGLINEVRLHDMRLLLEFVEDSHPRETYLDLVGSKRIDGIIFSGPRFDDKALQALLEYGFPTVLMGKLPDSAFHFVDIDNRAAARKAVTHLFNLGRTSIACITNANQSYTAAVERLQGYQEALEQFGLPYNADLVRYGDFDPESGYAQMSSLLKNGHHPEAVFVASDVVAIGAMAAIRERNIRIPEDIALVGFDDVPLARFLDPPLTTIRLPAAEMARLASKLVIQLIQGKQPENSQILLETELIVRESSSMSDA